MRLFQLVLIFILSLNLSLGRDNNTQYEDLRRFINLSLLVDPQNRLLEPPLAEKVLGVTFDEPKYAGRIKTYESTQMFDSETPLYQLKYEPNFYALLTLHTTLSLKEIKNIFKNNRSFKRAYDEIGVSRVQINGLPIVIYQGPIPHVNFQNGVKQFWVRIYECTSSRYKVCTRKVQLFFADSSLI